MNNIKEIEYTIKELESNSRIRINTNIDDLDKEYIKDHIFLLIKKYKSMFENSTVDIFIRKHRFQNINNISHYARIFIFTEKEDFDITTDHKEWRKAFTDALFRLKRKIERKKILIKNCGTKRFPYSFSDNYAFKRPKENITLVEGNTSGRIPVK